LTSTPIAKMVREMIARGIDPDVIELAVGTAEQVARADIPQNSADTSADRRREKDRERKRKIRGNPQNSADIPQTQEAPLTYLENSKEEKKEIKKERIPQNRGTRLPTDWQPLPDEWTDTVALIGADRARAELLKFRDYWIALPGAKGVKLDWPATWRNWIRRVSENTGGPNGQRNQHASRRPAGSDFFAGLRSVAEDLDGHREPPRDADPEIPLGRFNIDVE
jgi:hypothetical protein